MPVLGFWSLLSLFLCAAAWTVIAAACGGFMVLWAAHVGRTNCHPLPRLPRITLFRRKPVDEDEDDEPAPPRATTRVGP